MARVEIGQSGIGLFSGVEIPGEARGNTRPKALLFLASAVLFLTMFDRFVISGIPTMRTLAGVTGVVLSGAWALTRLPKYTFRTGPQLWLLVFLFGLTMIDVGRYLITGHFPIRNFLQWFQSLAFAVILFDLGRDPRAFRMYGTAIFLAVAYMGVASFVAPTAVQGRIGLAGLNFNIQAYFYAIAWITCLAILLDRWPRFTVRDFIVAMMALVFIFAQLRTGSRGGMLASTIGSLTLLGLMLRKRNLSAYISVVPAFLGAVAIFLMIGSVVVLERIGLTLESGDIGYRDVIFDGAIRLLRENPVFGAGPDFVEQLGVITRGRDTSTHNAYLQVATAYGLAGLSMFVVVILSTLKACWRHRQTMVGALLTALVVLSVAYGIAADLAFVRFFWAIMALASGLPLSRLARSR